MIFRSSSAVVAAALFCFCAVATANEPHHAHEGMAADVDAFHAVLAPVWHARPGKARTQNACAKAREMGRLARDIRSRDAKALAASVGQLEAACGKRGGDVDGALFDVHEAFHRLIEG